MEKKIDITVILITYNQEKYIEQALNSIFEQSSNLNIEILIGEDCSTDNTKEKLKEIEKSANANVKFFYNQKNIGASRNLYNLLLKSKGKYIAMLEGDDYWQNNNRLDILYNFLEANPHYMVVSHKRKRIDSLGNLVGFDPSEELLNKTVNLHDYQEGKNFSIMGSLFRNIFINSENRYEKSIIAARNACDNVISQLILNEGDAFILPDILGVYRVNSGNDSYCKSTRQDKVNYDSILQSRALIELLGDSSWYHQQIAYKIFDSLAFLLKRKKYNDISLFWKNLEKKEQWYFFEYLFKNIIVRFKIHLRGVFKNE